VRLADQDRTLWDQALIAEGQALVRACLRRGAPGPYQIQAAIAAVHSDAATAADTDWRQIVSLYDHLLRGGPTPSSRQPGDSGGRGGRAGRGLAEIERLRADLDAYQPYHATWADLLAPGRSAEAADAY
jgi:RNA polymerase sigma-70 factor (ECF subfamily)